MKKIVLFFCMFFTVFSSFTMEIVVYNNTDYPCNISANLKDFSMLVNYKKPEGRIELPKSQSVTLTLPKKSDRTEKSKNMFNFLLEKGSHGIFKKTVFSFPIELGEEHNVDVPLLFGKSKKSVTKLIGKNGFFVRKSMNDRHTAYVLEICCKDTNLTVEEDVLVSQLSPKISRGDTNTTMLLPLNE